MFRRELAEKIMRGEKTVTRRQVSNNPRSPWYRSRCIYGEGKVFTINPGRGVVNIGRARVVSCRREPLGLVAENGEAELEGFAGFEEFERVWKEINGSFRFDLPVWRLEMEVI